jgi:hypothetical protein
MRVWALREPSRFQTISSHWSLVWRVAHSIRSTRLGLDRYCRANCLSTKAGKTNEELVTDDRGFFLFMPQDTGLVSSPADPRFSVGGRIAAKCAKIFPIFLEEG